MKVTLVSYPSEADKLWVKQCAMGTVGKNASLPPTDAWMRKMLEARHSPIRELNFHFLLEDIPYWVSTHLVRSHVGCGHYVQSQRNDRQDKYDRNSARQDTPVTMRISMNAEALMVLANKRLCSKAAAETRSVVKQMCDAVLEHCREFEGLLVPMCEYNGNTCHELTSCGRCDKT